MPSNNGNNDSINRRANTRAPAPVDVTKGKRMGKSENKKKSNSGWVGVFRMRGA
jgi:hypothetical protein